MAKESTPETNISNRGAIIRSICRELEDIDARFAELAAERKKIKGRIKAELGEKISDFNVLRRFHTLEDEPRDQLFDLLREGFKALKIGEQGSFLTVLGDTPAAAPLKATKAALKFAFIAGQEVLRNGGALQDCPYKGDGTAVEKLRAEWDRGFKAAYDEREAQAGYRDEPDPPATAEEEHDEAAD